MSVLGSQKFLQTLPTLVLARLPKTLQLNVQQPYRWLVQFYDQDKRVHYEVQRIIRRRDFELALHFESRNKQLNQHLLQGFSQRLIAIHAELGESISAEPWDRGWAKIYDIFPESTLTEAYQVQMAERLAAMIRCFHPILLDLYDTPVRRERLYSF